jgi:hypothetical protein
MTQKEIKKLIENKECYLKEIFFTRRQVYEIVNNCDIRICTITYRQSMNIRENYKTILYKENYNGFTKRWYKIENY